MNQFLADLQQAMTYPFQRSHLKNFSIGVLVSWVSLFCMPLIIIVIAGYFARVMRVVIEGNPLLSSFPKLYLYEQ